VSLTLVACLDAAESRIPDGTENKTGMSVRDRRSPTYPLQA
jgi:hypothetical protein